MSIKSAIVLALMTCCASTAHADITSGLIAHYKMDGDAQDSSPFANHGTANAGMVVTTDRFGTPGGAYEFNGSSSYITIPNSASLASPTTAITMSAWILLYGSSKVGSPFSPILMKSTTGENGFMYRMIAHPTYFGSCYNNWTLHQNAAAAIPSTEWHHVATTFDGSRHRFYFDGVLISDQALALTITADTRALLIGADTPGAFEVFWGKIDDLRIYNRTLSDADIAELYAFLPVGVGEGPAVGAATAFAIRRAFPTPTAGGVTLEYTLPSSAPVDLEIRDVRGRLLRAYTLGAQPQGPHTVTWDGRTASGSPAGPGVFFARLSTRTARTVARIVRIE